MRAKTAADRLLGLDAGDWSILSRRRADGLAGSALLIGNCFPQVLSGDFYFDGARHTGTSEIERVMRAVPKVTAMRQTKERRKTYLSARAVSRSARRATGVAPKSSKVANERSKMHEKADLREANLNGAIIADAKLGGARLDEGFAAALRRAASDIVTTSDVTP